MRTTKRYQRYQGFESAKQETETLVQYRNVYRQLVEASDARELSQLGRLFDDFDVGTAMPIVFVVATADVDDQEKKAIYDRLESFIVRRAVCELTAQGRNLFLLNWLVTFGRMRSVSPISVKSL